MSFDLSIKEKLFSDVLYYSDTIKELNEELTQHPEYHLSITQQITPIQEALQGICARVEGTYLKNSNAIPDIGANELDSLQENLSQANTSIEAIQSRLTQLTRQATQSRPPLNSRPSVPVLETTNFSEHRVQRQAQDEAYKASEFLDKYRLVIEKQLQLNEPKHNFDITLPFLKEVKEYIQSKPEFISEQAKKELDMLVQFLLEDCKLYIEQQKELEEEQVDTSAVTTQTLGVHAQLSELMRALEGNNDSAIDEKFKNLDQKEKETIRKSIGTQQNREISGTMFNFGFSKWPGKNNNNEMKKVAVAEAMKQIAPSQTTHTPSPQVIECYAEEMQEQLNNLPLHTQLHQSLNSISVPIPVTNSEVFNLNNYSPEELQLLFSDEVLAEPQPVMNYSDYSAEELQTFLFGPRRILPTTQMKDSIISLQTILASLLETDTAELNMDNLISDLTVLESSGNKCVFKLTSEEPKSVVDRLFFHTYFIHKNECPYRLRDDMEYGRKAFFELEPGFSATHEQRERVIQRCLTEIAIEGLIKALESDDMQNVQEFLNHLEMILPHDLDSLKTPNTAHHLFGLFYKIYSEIQAKYPTTLIHPHDDMFRCDFGRHGFTHEAIPTEIKLEAIDVLLAELKAAWNI